MKSIDASKVLSKHLLSALNLFKVNETVTGPKGDEYHHFQEVHVIKGGDDYTISNVTTLTDDAIKAQAVDIHDAPMRFRGMSGVCITFWSEEHYIWTRSIFFHKGCLYQEDRVVQDNVAAYGDDDDTKPNEETNGY